MFSSHVFIVALALLSHSIHAVLYGDEQFGKITPGKFWAFYENGVAIIDPQTCSIEKKFESDAYPKSWYDGIYMEYDDGEAMKRYILINSGVSERNDFNELRSEALIFDVENMAEPLVDRVEMGGRPVHSYGVHPRNEYWAHSDNDGKFYVIHLSDISKHLPSTPVVFEDVPSHGKLLWDESPELGVRGFATATGEPILFEVDLSTKKTVRKFDFSTLVVSGTCGGSHAIAYSSVNQHVYVECTGGPPAILEFDVSNGDIELVKQWLGKTGALYETPDGSFVAATNKGGNKLHVFEPQATGDASELVADIDVPGHPSTVTFYPNGEGDEGDYTVCMPLTENTNEKQMGHCDYYGCTDAKSQGDVMNGVCLHHPDKPSELLRLNQTSIPDNLRQLTQTGQPCERCGDDNNFKDGMCTCTPYCGSCDSSPTYDDSKSGLRCIRDLGEAVKKANNDQGSADDVVLIPGAGAVRQGSPYSYSAECTFGRTYRTHKRGGKYDASIANIPSESIVIVDMEELKLKCQVPLGGPPSRVLYVPDEDGEMEETEKTKEASSSAEASTSLMMWAASSFIGMVMSSLMLA